MDRVISFSIPPTDIKSKEEIDKLKKHCKKNGINFSHLVVKAIIQLNKDLKL